LINTGLYDPNELLNYQTVDLTNTERKTLLLERDEFNFSVGVRFGEVPLSVVRETVAELMVIQKNLLAAA
jgi:hypothetical protein